MVTVPMTWDRAKLIANSPDTYTPEEWLKAGVFLSGQLEPRSCEDLHEGEYLIHRYRQRLAGKA